MGDLITVTGPLAPGGDDTCLLGEHLIARFAVQRPALAQDTWFFEQTVRIGLLGDLMLGRANRDDATLTAEHAESELERFDAAGGGLVVEVTSPEAGRDPRGLRRLSERTGVAIMMAAAARPDSTALIGELTAGIDGVRAGLVTLDGQALGSATADAAFEAVRVAGAPLRIDCAGDAGLARNAVSAANGAGIAPGRIAIAGAGGMAHDIAALTELAASGAYLAFDRLGRIPTIRTQVSDHENAVAIIALVKAGYGAQILLGTGHDRKHAGSGFGGNGLRFVSRQFLPYLGMLGVTPEAARQMATENPLRYLAWAEGAA